MKINGVALQDLGFKPRTRSFPNAGESVSIVQVQGRPGGRYVGGHVPAGTITVDGTIVGDDKADVESKLQQILELCQPGAQFPRAIEFSDYPDRRWLGRYSDRSSYSHLGRGWVTPAIALTMAFDLEDPRAEAVMGTQANLTSGVSETLDLGTAASDVLINISDPADIVEVDILGSNDALIRRLRWTGTGSAGSLVINTADYTVRQNGDIALDGLDATSVFPVADPAEGAAKIRVTGGAGILVGYVKRWWS